MNIDADDVFTLLLFALRYVHTRGATTAPWTMARIVPDIALCLSREQRTQLARELRAALEREEFTADNRTDLQRLWNTVKP